MHRKNVVYMFDTIRTNQESILFKSESEFYQCKKNIINLVPVDVEMILS
jgi:hypothetical protein